MWVPAHAHDVMSQVGFCCATSVIGREHSRVREVGGMAEGSHPEVPPTYTHMLVFPKLVGGSFCTVCSTLWENAVCVETRIPQARIRLLVVRRLL